MIRRTEEERREGVDVFLRDVRLGHAQPVHRIGLIFSAIEDGRIGQLVIEESFQVIPRAAVRRRFLSVGENAELSVLCKECEIEAFDWLAAFVRQLSANAAFVFEAGNFVAAGAAIVLDEFLAVLLQVWIIHEVGGWKRRVGMFLRLEVAGDVARFLYG